ncbi:MAG: site-specific integrase [Candidatus Bathyarchaeota archaeon]|nr:site-specific integrase [Candidatus Bathyarchaeota archaeon]
MVGSLGFEPRTTSTPGWYPRPLYAELNQDTQIPQTRRRPQQPSKYDDLIINTLIKATNSGTQEIINTLIDLKNRGLGESTIKDTSYKLRQLSKMTDLHNPEAVRATIANHKVANSTKTKMVQAYKYYAETHQIKWTPPRYRWERKIPLIPTTANIDKIIAAATRKYATIFTILKETGLEGHELATTTRKHIDSQQGIISAQGCKGHNSRAIKLKQKTADMLRQYLHKYTTDKPFPNSRAMGEAWRHTRNKLSKTLQEPQLKTIPLRNLRHYHATMLYDKTKDILLVKQRLGHKKIETTMFYTQLITFNEEEDYTCKTASNVKEATDLIEHGFEYITEMEGLKLFRKRK